MMRTEAGQDEPNEESATILMSANSFWNIRNFRAGLIDALVEQGWRVVIAAPGVDQQWSNVRRADSVEIRIDRSGTNPVRDLSLIANYHRLILRHQPKFFLGFTAKPNIYGSIAARFSGVACLPNVSGLGTAFINRGPLSALVGALYRIAFSKCPVVFFQNSDDSEMFVRRRIVRPDQVWLLPGSGVDLDRFVPPPPAHSGEPRFLFIGRLLGDKGVREFVEAARILRRSHQDWKFQLLGPIDEGNRSGVAQPELDRWLHEGVVEYLGRTEDVRPYIAESTAVVLPSYREGLPRSLLEAAAMARPLIATDVPGNRRIVEQGINGLLCKPRDHASLAQAMESVGLMDAGRREAMGRAGRIIVERAFGEKQVIRAYQDAKRQLQGVGRS
jgi:glycosyltransferase involved in cell wall biosynthesis